MNRVLTPSPLMGEGGVGVMPAALLALAVGLAYTALLMGPRPLDPTDLDWMKGDQIEHYLGWLFYTQTPASSFPLTWTERLGYPLGSYVSLTDPALPALLGWFRQVIPPQLQFFGWLFVANIALMLFWGCRLIGVLEPGNRFAGVIGGLLLTLSPTLAASAPGNYCGQFQWLIVAALYFLLRPVGERRLAWMAPLWLLTGLAAALHPYIGAMVGLVAAAGAVRLVAEKRTSPGGGLALLALCAICFAGVLYSLGILSVGGGAAAGGYSDYSLNLLGPFNDEEHKPLMRWHPEVFPAQEVEGFSYLGLGVFLLIGLTLAQGRRLRHWRPSPRAITAAAVVAICLTIALSNRVTFGRHVLFEYPLPGPLSFLTQAFRAPGRFFWPVQNLLVAGCVAVVASAWRGNRARLLLVTALVLEYLDLHGLHKHVRRIIDEPSLAADAPALQELAHHSWGAAWPWTDGAWRNLGRDHRHLVVLPAWQCGMGATPGGTFGYALFGRLAADQRMTVNEYRASRYAPASLAYHCGELPARVLRGQLEADTAYVLNDGFFLGLAAAGGNTGHLCGRIDGYILCRQEAGGAASHWSDLAPPLPAGSTLSFTRGGDGVKYLQTGWQTPDDVRAWSSATEASLTLPLATPGPIALTLHLFPMLGPNAPQQEVRLLASGTEIARWTLSGANWQQGMTAHVPASALRADGLLQLTLAVNETRSLKGLGYATADDTLLGVGLQSIAIGTEPPEGPRP